jgi:hypothetical protein
MSQREAMACTRHNAFTAAEQEGSSAPETCRQSSKAQTRWPSSRGAQHTNVANPRGLNARRTGLAEECCHAAIKSRRTCPTGDDRHNTGSQTTPADSLEESQLAAPVGTLSPSSDVADTPFERASLEAAASRRAALEPAPEPPAEAGPVGIATNLGVSAVQRVDACRDEPEHRGKRRRTRCCAVEDEDRENRNDRDQRKADASPVL